MFTEIFYTKIKKRKSSSSLKFAIIRSKARLYGSAKAYLLPPIMSKFNFKGEVHFKRARWCDFKHANSHFMSQPESAVTMWTIEEALKKGTGDATWKLKGFNPPNIQYSRGSLWDQPQTWRSAAPLRSSTGHIWTQPDPFSSVLVFITEIGVNGMLERFEPWSWCWD